MCHRSLEAGVIVPAALSIEKAPLSSWKASNAASAEPEGQFMGIVSFALRFKHTFYVLALMMLFLGGSAIFVTPKDIFPNINIPVVTVIWQYTGLTPDEMDQRVNTYSEYYISTNVSDIHQFAAFGNGDRRP
jgi:AcrB/AcrD/AcrF family